MKVIVSLKGRGTAGKKRGRKTQGYFCRRKGNLRFYPFDNTSIGQRIKSRQPMPKRKRNKRKY